MDSVTHIAAGLLTAQTLRAGFRKPGLRLGQGLDRGPRGLSLLCVVAASLPDIDSVAGWFGPESYLLHHRGVTHSLFALPFLALLLAFGARRLGSDLTLRQGFLASALALLSHLFLDVITAFGTQLFAPFSDVRVSFPGVFIVDPAFTLPLLALALAARLNPERARALALWGLALLVAYPLAGNALRLNMQSRYEALLTRRGQAFDRVVLTPDALAPYYWKVLLENGPDLFVTSADFADIARPYPALRLLRTERAELLRLGREASIFRTYAWFAEYPAEYPADAATATPPGLHARRFVDATFVNSGPVLTALFGPGPGFAECTSFINDSGRLMAWRDWRGVTHPVPEAAAGDAHAAMPAHF